MTSLTPPGRPTHTFDYNPADLLERYTAPPATSGGPTAPEQSTYSGHRRLRTLTRADGGVATTVYRTDGKPDHRTTSRGTTTFGYDATSTSKRLTTLTESDNRRITFAYDGYLPTIETWSGGTAAVAGSVTRQYNADLRVSATRVNTGSFTNFSYDGDGLLLTAGGLTIQRDPVSGDIDGTTLGAITTQQETNGFGELDGFIAQHGATQLFSEQITQRDAEGRILQKVETVLGSASTYDYTYDAVGRLTDVERDGVLTAHYDYDSNGNRLAATRGGVAETGSYDARDRLITYAGGTYGFDNAGDLQSVATATGTTTYDYDELGNLRTLTLPDARVIQYEIDSLNRRTGKRINGVRQYGLLYKSRLAPVALLGATNQVVASFVYGTSDHVPDFMIRGSVTYRFITDHLGTVRLVVNTTTGAIAQRLDYDEFGKVVTDTAPGFQPFGFAGGLYDADTGFVRFGARDYDAVTGRWTAKDPILFDGGQENLYVYVNGDSVNRTDPNGLDGGASAAALGGAVCAGSGVCEAAAIVAGLVITVGICIDLFTEEESDDDNKCNFAYDLIGAPWGIVTKECYYICRDSFVPEHKTSVHPNASCPKSI